MTEASVSVVTLIGLGRFYWAALCRRQRAITWLSGQGTISERNFPVPISGVWSPGAIICA